MSSWSPDTMKPFGLPGADERAKEKRREGNPGGDHYGPVELRANTAIY